MKRSKLLKQTKEQISDTLRLPKDLAKGEALVSITGQEEAFMEYYTNEEMKIEGMIQKILFL